MGTVSQAKASQNTADNLIGSTSSKPILKRGSDKIKQISNTEIVTQGTYSGTDGWVVGNPNYDEVGVATVGSPTITSERTNIVNFDNAHYEYFSTDVLKDSDDTSEWGDGNVGINFNSTSVEEIISTSIFKNNETVTKVKIVLLDEDGDQVTNLVPFVRASTGDSWQQIILNTLTVLTTPGSQLYYKLSNSTGAGTVTSYIEKAIITYEAYE